LDNGGGQMSEIKKGYNNKKVTINLETFTTSHDAGMWIEFDEPNVKQATLQYITIEELIELRDEINDALAKLVGVDK
jgi:hypothetical protein